MYTVDLHAHSRFFHGWPGRRTAYDPVGLRSIALVARARGVDAVVVTNHDYVYPERPRRIAGVTLLPGIEVSTGEGHVLVIGPDPPRETTPGELSAPATVELAHDRGCAAILAHPFRGSDARHTDAAFDAVEINGKNPEHAERTRELAAERELSLVGGSDAHYPPEIGRVFTELDCPSLTPRAIVEAVRAGRSTPVVEFDGLQRVLDVGYTAIHGAKDRMRTYWTYR